MPDECIHCSTDKPIDNKIVESAGHQGKAKSFGLKVSFNGCNMVHNLSRFSDNSYLSINLLQCSGFGVRGQHCRWRLVICYQLSVINKKPPV
jgi:hypothetical protein